MNDLLDRLDAAHEAAAQIPDILAEIRERVGKHGYDLVARSPFVERTDYESELVESVSASETPKEDMTDWCNWREGDLVTWEIGDQEYPWWTPGKLYEVKLSNKNLVIFADDDDAYHISGDRLSGGASFRFHSRPQG